METCIILVDNTNLFVGGQQYSAHCKHIEGQVNGHAAADHSWRLDYTHLYEFLASQRRVEAALVVGGCPPHGECAWEKAAKKASFEVILHPVNSQNLEKEVDTDLVARGTEYICTSENKGIVVLASGDRDFVPLVEVAHRHGWKVELCAFSSSFHEDGELAQAADKVRLLDNKLKEVGHYE